MELPPPPAGLRTSGRDFWTSTQDAYELDARDRPVLVELCRVLDEIDDLKAAVDHDGVMSTGASGQPVEHPALGGLRSHRTILDRLIVRLGLPDSEGKRPMSTSQLHSRVATDARWAEHRQNRAVGTD